MRTLPLPVKEGPRINRDIRIREVMLIDADGQNKGVVQTFDAIKMAEDQGLDLVEVAPQALIALVRAGTAELTIES